MTQNPHATPRWHYIKADQLLAELEEKPCDQIAQLAYLRGKLALAQLHATLATCGHMQNPHTPEYAQWTPGPDQTRAQ